MNIDFNRLLQISSPLWILLISAFLLLLMGLWLKGDQGRRVLFLVSFLSIGIALVRSLVLWDEHLGGRIDLLLIDPFSAFLSILILLFGLLSLLLIHEQFEKQNLNIPEVYSLFVFCLSGMIMMVLANHFILFFLGLEVMSLALYVLVCSRRKDIASNEAAMKYFVLGALVAGIFLYGVALIYGATGTMMIHEVGQKVMGNTHPTLLSLGMIMVVLAFAFKIAAAPFHFWAPDVYEGAPSSLTSFMSTAVKVAAFGALVRVMQSFTQNLQLPWEKIYSALAILSMVWGNLAALKQRDLKRMLAYSSVAHAGYMLVGILSACSSQGELRQEAIAAVLYYLLAYGIASLGAFAVISRLSGDLEDASDVSYYRGLSERSPFYAFAMAAFMLALTGIPPTVGFSGKFFLFKEAIYQSHYTVVIIGVLMSAVSAYYYLSVIVSMYFSKNPQNESLASPKFCLKNINAWVLLFCIVAVLYFGLAPSRYIEMTTSSPLIGLNP